MANNNNEGADNNPDNSKDSGLDKSFVGKFMSGIFNSTPLSKWFGKDSVSGSGFRRRDEDASFILQPPTKRPRLPNDTERGNCIFESPVTVHASNNVNNATSKVFPKFPEAVPGPSGLKSRKLFEKHHTSSTNTVSNSSFENHMALVNGDRDSDSGESTSGYSSAPKLISQAKINEFSNAKEEPKTTPKARTLFTSSSEPEERTLFPDPSSKMNTSLSSRRPSFNASTFGSPNFVDKTISTRKIINSPFYCGRTMYGGASAYGRKLLKAPEDPTTGRTSVQIKPVNEKATTENMTLSKTARRILSTLEQYSTPISDAKKIPVAQRKPGLISTYVGATPYLVRERKRPSNKELQVPSVPDLLKMKQKERLQNSTESVRQMATSSKSTLNKEEYRLRTEEDDKQKHSNKMKSSVASVRQKMVHDEPVQEVNLPKVSLPINTLPKFDFVLMPPKNSEPKKDEPKITNITSITIPVNAEKKNEKKDASVGKYKFAEPLVISKDKRQVAAINCFKFSEPLSKKQENFKSGVCDLKNGGFKIKNNGENVNCTAMAKPTPTPLTGSVMGVSRKEEPKWECSSCWVRNEESKSNCVACNAPKLKKDESKGKESEKWECSACWVRNNKSDEKCVACGGSKPGAKTVGFGDKFKPSASTWECSSCMVRNNNDTTTCVACNASKVKTDSGFGDSFKPASDTWECTTCMIRNKTELEKCAACQSSKPKSTLKFPLTSVSNVFNYGPNVDWSCKSCSIKNKGGVTKCAACGTPKETVELKGFGSSFSKKNDEWECDSCMVRNKDSAIACVCCGLSRKTAPSAKLVELSKSEDKKVNCFNFGIDTANAPKFQFGIPAKSEPETKSTSSSTISAPSSTAVTTTVGFSFGVPTQIKSPTTSLAKTETTRVNPLLKPNEKLPEEAVTAPAGFTFGASSNLKSQASETPKQSVESVVTSSKPQPISTTTTINFGTIPAFQFKPPAVNGEINKPKESSTLSEAPKPSSFVSDSNKQEEKTKEQPTFGISNKTPEVIKFGTTKSSDSPFGVTKTESPFAATTKSDSPFGGNKSMSPFVVTTTKSDSVFSGAKKQDSPFAVKDSTFSKPVESPFTNKTTEAPIKTNITFGTTTSKSDSPFGAKSESLFGNSKSLDSPFGAAKPADSPFGNVSDLNKPKNSFFGTSTTGSKSVFGNTETTKPQESIFGNDANKTKDLFGTKPAESSTSVFGSSIPQPGFNFAMKSESSAPTPAPSFPSTSQTQTPAQAVFKFGGEPPQNQLKKPFESDNNLMNGFGSTPAKVAAFGAPQFGASSEATSKPFAFGSAESTPKSSGFSFTQTEKPAVFAFGGSSAPSAPSGGFNFAAPAAPSGTFSFGGAASKPETQQPFNAQPPASNVFGAAKNSNFNFGAPATSSNQKAVFSFGGGQTQAAPPAAQPSFPAASTTGFNFGAPAAPSPTPAFNFSGAPPTFNFDGNSSQAQSQRRIKKAIRRTHR